MTDFRFLVNKLRCLRPSYVCNLHRSHSICHRVEHSLDLTLLQFTEEGLADGSHADFNLVGTEVTRCHRRECLDGSFDGLLSAPLAVVLLKSALKLRQGLLLLGACGESLVADG